MVDSVDGGVKATRYGAMQEVAGCYYELRVLVEEKARNEVRVLNRA